VGAGRRPRQFKFVGGLGKRATLGHPAEDPHCQQLVHQPIVLKFRIECNGYSDLSNICSGVPSLPQQQEVPMFNRKCNSISVFPLAIGTGLLVSVTLVVTVLIEAVASMQSFL
jgi:hypothetical protein